MLQAHALGASAAADAKKSAHVEGKSRIKSCIFCRLSQNSHSEDSEYLQEHQEYLTVTDELFAVPDIKPSAKHHFLVITHQHIKSPKLLTKKDIPLIKTMADTALRILKAKNNGKDLKDDYRMGFHWPPMMMIKHLHMHAFYPVSSMSAFNKHLLFRPGMFFVTPERLIEWLQTKNEE